MVNASVHQKRLLLTAVAAVLATPFLIFGAWRTMDGIYTSALHWLDPSTPERARYEAFAKQFEGGNFLLISWQGCTLDDPRLAELEQAFRNSKEATGAGGPVERVFSGRSIYEQLTQPEMRLTDQPAHARLLGSLVGPDGESTCLFLVLTENGARRRAPTLALVKQITTKATGLEDEQLHIAGPLVDALAIDIESDKSVDFYAAPSALVSFFLCLWCLRSFRYAAAILAVAGFSELMVLGALYFCGVTMDAVLITLPPLVFVLTVSAGIHLVNYYFDQVRSGAGADAPRRAVLQGWLPCSLAALTTAIGLGSLLVSRIVPVYTFGVFAAGGVMLSLLILFFTLPGVMCRWPMRREDTLSAGAMSVAVVLLVRMGKVICNHASVITAACMALLVWGGMGLAHLKTSVGVENLLAPSSRVVRDFRWIEQHVANLAPLEVVIRFPADTDLQPVFRLLIVSKVEKAIRSVDEVGGTLSAATFVPNVPEGRGSRNLSIRSQINGRLKDSRQELINSNYLAQVPETRGPDAELWRVSSRVSGRKHIDFEEVLVDLRAAVEPVLDEAAATFGVRATAEYTGVMPLVFRAQHALLEDMFASMLVAFGLVWLVMSLVLSDFSRGMLSLGEVSKSLWLGALAMLPNLFPIVVVFGAMGWLGWPADIGSTMTACVALGIAVDDTLHFLAWYRRETAKGDGPALAIRHSFQHCGRAMIQTTLICGVGMLIFGLSGFMPTKRFAVLMFTLLTAALAADLVFLPAILASPLGSLFAVRPGDRGENGVGAGGAPR